MKKIYLFISICIFSMLISCSEDKDGTEIEEFIPQTFRYTASFNVKEGKEGKETEIIGTKVSVPATGYDHNEIVLVKSLNENIRISLNNQARNAEDYTFTFTTLPNNRVSIKIGNSNAIDVSPNDDLYFASHAENDCEFCLKPSTLKTPAGGLAYDSYKGPSDLGGNKLYRTANFNIYVNNGKLNIQSKQYGDVSLNKNNEFDITVYRSTGILTADVILFKKIGDKQIVNMEGWSTYLSGTASDWTVTPFITNYPKYFDITLPTAGSYKVQDNENVSVVLNAPVSFESGRFNYVISSTEGASNIAAYGTKTTATPWLFNGSLNHCTLKLYIRGAGGEEFIASKALAGNTLLTNDIKRFYLYINVEDLRDTENQLRTTSFNGKEIKEVPISFCYWE